VNPCEPTHANGVTYDTGALIAADLGVRAFWLRHEGFLRAGVVPTVPTVVLAQAWRSARQVALARLLTGCVLEELSAVLARAVGLLAAPSGHSDVVDLAVAEGALRRGDLVLTSDPGRYRPSWRVPPDSGAPVAGVEDLAHRNGDGLSSPPVTERRA